MALKAFASILLYIGSTVCADDFCLAAGHTWLCLIIACANSFECKVKCLCIYVLASPMSALVLTGSFAVDPARV